MFSLQLTFDLLASRTQPQADQVPSILDRNDSVHLKVGIEG